MTPVEEQILRNQLAIMAALSEMVPTTDRAVDFLHWLKICVTETAQLVPNGAVATPTWPPPCTSS